MRRQLRFLSVGALNTVAGLAIILGSKAWLGSPDLIANMAGYAGGLALSFFLNRRWTFEHRGNISTSAFRFVIAFAVAYALNLATVFGLKDWAGVNAYFAQIAGVVPYTIFLYCASAYYVFRRPAVSASAGTGEFSRANSKISFWRSNGSEDG